MTKLLRLLMLLVVFLFSHTAFAELTDTITSYPYTETFSSGAGQFYVDDVTLPSGMTTAWSSGSYSSTYYMKATGYYNSKNNATESWLISPVLDLTKKGSATLSFKHAINKYFGTVSEEATLWVRKNGGSWTQVTITYPDTPSSSWSSFVTNTIDLTAYVGNYVQFAFKYVGTTSSAGTWEVADISVTATEPEISYTTVTSFEELKALDSGTYVKLSLPLTNVGIIEYNDEPSAARTTANQDAYVRDNTGAVQVHNFLPNIRGFHTIAGGGLVGSIFAQYVVTNGMPQLVAVDQSVTEQLLCLDKYATPTPRVLEITDLAAETYRADYIQLESVKVIEQDGLFYVTDGTNTIQISDEFALGLTLVASNSITLTGILGTDDNATSEIYLLTFEASSDIPSITLDEDEINSTTISLYADNSVDVTVKRSLVADMWNTICLPFSTPDITEYIGNAQVAKFVDYDATTNTLKFETTQQIEAGVPYLIKPSESISQFVVGGATMVDGLTDVTQGIFTLKGIYDPTTLEANDKSVLFMGANNVLYYPNVSNELRAFRAYFKSSAENSDAKIDIDGVATGIETVEVAGEIMNGKVYNLNGQYMGESLNGLRKGVYIVNGKKIIIK